MLVLWYNGISASHARARAAQLYHIFGELSIGNFAQKAKDPLQGLAFGNEVFSVVFLYNVLNNEALTLIFCVEVEDYMRTNVNVAVRDGNAFVNSVQMLFVKSGFNLPQFVLACLFLAPLDAEHADKVTQTNDNHFQPQGQVANGVDHNDGVKTVGDGIDHGSHAFSAFNGGDRLYSLNDDIDDVQNDEHNEQFVIHSINPFLIFCNYYNITLIICQ